ncbi:MAG: DNA repair protein RecO [Lawsonibacter sp.]|jgi:DNA repair protein RecO (recombination protein O)|nr:DNA repair protein RecO [Lawsonibacter sp.]
MHITTKALVLRGVDYKESDKILTLFTQSQGKLTASARGCRRKGSAIAAGCQLLAWSEMVLYDYQGRWSVKEAAAERLFQGVRDDIARLALGCYFAEAAELLAVEGEENPELLSLILNSLHALDKMPEKPLPLVKAAFEWKAMALAGYEPLIDGCDVCGAEPPEEPRFHLREGVLHCAGCRGQVGEGISMPLSLQALSALRHIVYGDPKRLFSFRLEGEPLKQLADGAEAYLYTQLERGFRTLDYYKNLEISPLH